MFYSGFQNPYKKSMKQENASLFMNSILYNGKMRVENQTKTWVWEDSSFCQKRRLFKNSISGLWCDFAVTFVQFYFQFFGHFLWLSCWFEVKIVLEGVTAWWLTQKLDTRLMALLSLPPPSSHSCLKSRPRVCVIDLTCFIVTCFMFFLFF